ncbi:hypothetical protein KIPB_000776, partial [Kipferlia bialata]|eukprot:g776.t1
MIGRSSLFTPKMSPSRDEIKRDLVTLLKGHSMLASVERESLLRDCLSDPA